MGRRTKRRVKVLLPKRPSQKDYAAAGPTTAADFAAAADAAAAGIDPEAPGFNERALLMGLMESMDPSTRAQFEQYMANQLQQVEAEQQQSSAVDFLQAALDKAAEKSLNPEQQSNKRNTDLNPAQLFEGAEGDAVMWQSLRGEQHHASAAAVLFAPGISLSIFSRSNCSGTIVSRRHSKAWMSCSCYQHHTAPILYVLHYVAGSLRATIVNQAIKGICLTSNVYWSM
jgi:hypothetical protein